MHLRLQNETWMDGGVIEIWVQLDVLYELNGIETKLKFGTRGSWVRSQYGL